MLGVPFDRRHQQAWEQQTLLQLPTAQPQKVSNIIWALGTLAGQMQPGSELAGALRTALPLRLTRGNPQNVANSLWGFRKLGWQLSEEEVQAVLEAAERAGPEMIPQHLSNVIWAWADSSWLGSGRLLKQCSRSCCGCGQRATRSTFPTAFGGLASWGGSSSQQSWRQRWRPCSGGEQT